MTKIERIQEILEVKIDNDWGAESQGALDKVIRQSMEVEKAATTKVTASNHPFISIAKKWMGVGETSFNRFPNDKKLWADTSYEDGYLDRQPYCAAFMAHVIAEAIRKGAKIGVKRPTTAKVSEFRKWARANGLMVSKPQPGDLFTLLPSGTSHIGLVGSVSGRVISTYEGNTDGAGSREGDGFHEKDRLISKCDFFRIPIL